MLTGKKILLGITGSIAAYKSVALLRSLRAEGAEVTVVMTPSAQKFVAPLTFQALSGRTVYTGLFVPGEEMAHITLGEGADLILVAPSTAHFLAKLSSGLADDLLSALILASSSPVLIVPAMDGQMWTKPVTQRNVRALLEGGFRFVWPEKGLLASGKTGEGRMAPEETIRSEVEALFRKKDLIGKRVCITAGPTLEPIDPVRFVSNRSTGKMGYALAEEAESRGALVTLISGPVALPSPPRVKMVRIETAEEMDKEVSRIFPETDVLIMSAAVADYTFKFPSPVKIKKREKSLDLSLVRTKDILLELGREKKKQILVGFAAETDSADVEPLLKLKRKNLDLLVANNVTLEGAGFGSDTNIATLYRGHGEKISLPKMSKRALAEKIFDSILKLSA